MIISGMKTQAPSYKSIRLWLWLAVILLCLVGGGIRLWQNHQHHMAKKAREQKCVQIKQAADKTWVRLLGLHRQRPRLTRGQLVHLINDGKPFAVTSRGGKKDIVHWIDPLSGATFRLTFFSRDDQWSGLQSPQLNYPPIPTPPPFDQLTEEIQRQFAGSFSLGWGTGAWLVALALCIFWKQQRQVLAEIMFALTLMCGTAWLTWPYYSLTIKGIFSNDMLFWAAIMLVISVGAIGAARRSVSPPPWPVCARCGYNLTGNVSGVCPECGERI